MATKARVIENAFRFGCGRYLQEDNALSLLGEELKLLGCSHPLIVAGKTAFSVAGETIKASLTEAGISYEFYEYHGFCNPDHGARIAESETCKACDCIVGVGGGNIMDVSKLIAALVDYPIVNIPTSSATCAAFTPLSVMYNENGQTIGTRHHKKEVNCILADMTVLCRQPVRLLVSGIYDAIAKVPETRQRLLGKTDDEIEIGLSSSFCMSNFMSEKLLSTLDTVCADVAAKRNTKTVYDAVYMSIALTGMISSLARGCNQTAIAHKVYETTRTLFPREAHDGLHGELVAIGLLVQLLFNGDEEAEKTFRRQMAKFGMPTSLSAFGIPATEETVLAYYDKILHSSAMIGCTEEENQRLLKYLNTIL